MKIPAALIESLRRYAAPFERELPPALALFAGRDPVFPFAAGSDRGLAVLLLAAALQKPGGEEAAARLLAFLYARFEGELFRLNRIPFETLAEAVEASGAIAAEEEAERKRVPGILRSACDFLDARGALGLDARGASVPEREGQGLEAWLASAPDWEATVRAVAGSVYWMGRQSLLKNKARYFLWLTAQALASRGSAAPALKPARDFAWPISEGHGRFYNDFLRKPRSPGIDPARRLALFADLAREAFPEAGWRLYAPLDAYLKRGGAMSFRCREAQGGCKPCPLSKGCPAAPHFIPGER